MTFRVTVTRLTAATGYALLALVLGAASAGAEAVPGPPSLTVERSCVPYGDAVPVSGSGFAPRALVAVSAPPTNAVAPSRWSVFETASVTTDATGAFRTQLRPLRGPGPLPRTPPYEARIVTAEGTAAGGGLPGSPVAAFVLAQPGVCEAIDEVRARRSRGFAFSLTGRTLTVALRPGAGARRRVRSVAGRRITAACGTTVPPRRSGTVHAERRWPRGRRHVTFRFGRDIAASARWCLIERAQNGGDIAIVRF
jgi:hypothetical protein